MKKLSCHSFELGRLILQAPDPQTAALVRVFGAKLKAELLKAYGVNFRIKILEE
jgi:hypothetical protein